MENINELAIRKVLKRGGSTSELTTAAIKNILDESLPWEEKRPFWHFLFLSGRDATLTHALVPCLRGKLRVPFDLILQLSARANVKPTNAAIEALLKGARRQEAEDELIVPTGWDHYDKRFREKRGERLALKAAHQKAYKDGLLEKFEFLQSQRMTEQARRTLRRMVELYPDDAHFAKLMVDFEEHWAREVLANHAASIDHERIDQTMTAPSTADEEMLLCFTKEGEELCLKYGREVATDLCIAFWFMEDYTRALNILAWAPATESNDWLKAEVLFASRRYIETLEFLNQLEIKYVGDPETIFAVSYLRAQCLRASGQTSAGLEILQGIVRVRPNYRSVNALLKEWTEGGNWE